MRLAFALPVILAACVASAETPTVSDYNGHTVKVISHPYALGHEWKKSPTYAVAVQTCGRDAVYQGTRRINQYQGEHVYLCR